jgi:hypothetical protein
MAAAFWPEGATAVYPPCAVRVHEPLTPTTSGMGLVGLLRVTGAGSRATAGAVTPVPVKPTPRTAAVRPATILLCIQIAFDLRGERAFAETAHDVREDRRKALGI